MTAKKSKKELVLVTGCGGLIGTRLQEALLSDFEVVGLDLREPKDPIEGTTWLQCDLTDKDSVAGALGAVRKKFGKHIASVIHLAAYYDFSGKPSPLYQKLTVGGTRRLIHALQEFEVEQFVFSSSLLVMKPARSGEQLSEEDPTRAEWDYPRSKLEAERVLHAERGHIPVVILRLAGVYDEGCHSLPIAQQIRRIYEKRLESYFFPGNKTHGQAFVHLDDAIACIQRVIKARKRLEPDETFLVAEPEVLSYEALQERLGELIHDKAWPSIRIPKPVAKAGAWAQEKLPGSDPFIKPWMIDLADDHYPVEIERVSKALDWKPGHRLSKTLPQIVKNLKNSPQEWYEENGLELPREFAEPAGKT